MDYLKIHLAGNMLQSLHTGIYQDEYLMRSDGRFHRLIFRRVAHGDTGQIQSRHMIILAGRSVTRNVQKKQYEENHGRYQYTAENDDYEADLEPDPYLTKAQKSQKTPGKRRMAQLGRLSVKL